MKLHIRVAYLKGFKSEAFEKVARYRDDNNFVDIQADALTEAQLDTLIEKAKAAKGEVGARGLLQKITAYRNVRANPMGKSIGRLDQLVIALKGPCTKTPFCPETPNIVDRLSQNLPPAKLPMKAETSKVPRRCREATS